MMAKCCCVGGVANLDAVAPIWRGRDEGVRRSRRNSCPCSVLAMTVPMGVVLLLGGVAKVCRHLHISRLGLVAVFGRKPRFGVESA
eukprot:UN05412